MLLAWFLGGCAHHIVVASDPPGATVDLDGRHLGVTPLDVDLPWRPIGVRRYQMEVRLPDHRLVETSLRSQMRFWKPVTHSIFHPNEALRGDPLHTLHFVMIPRHQGAGTWGPDDVP